MSYQTEYYLEASSPEPVDRERIRKLEMEVRKMNVFDEGNYADGWISNAKWYDYEQDVALLSKRFPEFHFYLKGTGERSDDIWAAYFLNGEVMRDAITISYHSFDRKKLVPVKQDKDGKYSCQE